MTTRTTETVSDVPADSAGAIAVPRLDQQLCFALYSASGLMTKLYRPLLDPLGLTYPQYLAMLVLWERAPSTVGALGEALGLDSATLTPLIKRMEAGGLVTRRRDSADERRVLVEPTAKGQALRARVKGVQAGLDCAMPMERAELKALHGTLTRLVAGLREATE
ncbi:MarR family transcriptional regulator [Mesorhizobium sp. M4B.F.Ca.ET.215.01.1.1]|uniref:MarR family winged helix-turn-helix transcriptional regulator n=1 Tax=unclassified Mesorhizobium TaxID=325217 RepID=UPI000FC9DF2A|nr:MULTISPECIES: MarR family transcriptional regulator [unclassified Mesorhizobium]RUW28279.1 MarR family transcriptional regulator [Mesorhizobium sp. M4B.F.Ca.ET.013.02.1.1]RVD33533.1 MarR family transcriptional regulator [Mesorhizobium sp. M4B.F.Ca.ET.019.03.1.1]RWF64510.1 MAG: MarR family transcriptional regulator [Mesorhizobium sp.]TGQ10724.1 MarR family transcriptional regulator [Mesorhizobium sp. M4B.F.Ca.ET.215.01.1.1]TGQ36293.1 MarR family transcriptional regulator [Mesorhizobium sp. M